MPADLYDVLGVSADASQEALKRAYRGRVREYHPDVNDHPDADEQFKLVRTANDVLSNPAERKDYDRLGHRSYVEKHLDDLPPLSVFPELEGRPGSSGTDDGGDATVASSGGTSTSSPGSRTTATGSESSDSSSGTSSTSTSTANAESSRSGSTPSSSATTASSSTTGSTDRASGSQSDGSGNYGPSAGSSAGQSSASAQSTATDSATGQRRERDDGSATSKWDQVTETTASQTTESSGLSEGERRRRGLKRWYGLVLLSMLGYLGALGAYGVQHLGALRRLGASLVARPRPTLLAPLPLPSPVEGVLRAVQTTTPTLGAALAAGTGLFALVTVTTIARFGRGRAWVYALCSLGPVGMLAAWRFLPPRTAVATLLLVVLPLAGGLGFLVAVGRYLLATR